MTKAIIDRGSYSLIRRAKNVKSSHDNLVTDIRELVNSDKKLEKHLNNSRLPRFVEKLRNWKGDITPSMLVSVSEMIDDYVSGNVYTTKYKSVKQRRLEEKYGHTN